MRVRLPLPSLVLRALKMTDTRVGRPMTKELLIEDVETTAMVVIDGAAIGLLDRRREW